MYSESILNLVSNQSLNSLILTDRVVEYRKSIRVINFSFIKSFPSFSYFSLIGNLYEESFKPETFKYSPSNKNLPHPCGNYNDDTLKILKKLEIKVGFIDSCYHHILNQH